MLIFRRELMNYQLKKRVWSWDNTYDINSSNGELAFQVIGKYFSWGHNLTIHDATGAEVATIEQRLMSFMPTYYLNRRGSLFAEIRKKFSWFKKTFELDIPGPNDYTIEGSFWDYEYYFYRRGQAVAQVSKAFWSWSDTYGVEIVDGEDDLSILATMVVIDLCNHEQGSS